jgi:hypothetical protein
MPEAKVRKRAAQDKAEGKSGSTQAGEFVREEMHHIREGKHGARSAKQAIAIGLSKARRAGVELATPSAKKASTRMRRAAERDTARGKADPTARPSRRRQRATTNALKKEGRTAASHRALSRQATSAAKRRSPAARSRSAKAAARTRADER